MSEALSQIVAAAVASKRNRTKQHLCPAEDGVRLAYYSVQANSPGTNSLFVDVQLQVNTKYELKEDRDEENVGECAVNAREEGAAAVRVSEYIAS